MNNLTAVEWLFLQAKDKQLDLFDLLEAKSMERAQSANDYTKGQESMSFKFPLSAEEYFNETYKGGEE